MIGKLDKEIIEKFKEFQEKTGKHSELYIEDVEFEKVNADKTNDYFMIYNGQRLKKSDLENIKDSLDDPIEVYSATESNEEVFGYIERKKLLKISPNHRIYNGKTVLLNTGGSVGAVRFKNNDFDYTVIDNVIVYVAKQDIFSIDYLYFSLKAIIKNDNFGYSNTLRGKDLEKANLIIPLPKDLNKFYPSFQIQEAIVEFLEFWKDGYTDVIRDKVSKKKPIYESIKRIVVQNTFKDDKFLVKKFNDFAKEQNYNLKLEDIDYIEKPLYNIAEFPAMTRVSGGIDLKIYEYEKLDIEEQKQYFALVSGTVENNQISGYIHKDRLAKKSLSNSNVITWTRINSNIFFIQKKPVCTNDDSFVMDVNSNFSIEYVKFSTIVAMKKKSFHWGNKAGKTVVKSILILVPKPLNGYSSKEIQQLLVKFWEIIIKQIDDKLAIYQRMIELTDIIDRAFLYRTFSKIDWST